MAAEYRGAYHRSTHLRLGGTGVLSDSPARASDPGDTSGRGLFLFRFSGLDTDGKDLDLFPLISQIVGTMTGLKMLINLVGFLVVVLRDFYNTWDLLSQ